MNWNKFLNKKRIEGRQWADAEILSKDWVTCACGQQDIRIPRNELNAPRDRQLRFLGKTFHEHIRLRDKGNALICLSEIEKRSSEILNQILNDLSNNL